MSTQNPSFGTKVTDPSAPAITEPSGPVASDSLAAESNSYKESNRGGEPLGVSGSNSTFANTNTSAADKLPPAPDAPARLSDAEKAGKTYQTQDKATAVTNTTGSSTTGGASSHADPAPTYIASQYIRAPGGPKGRNIHEGGFESDDSKNASWNTDVGSADDPARVAELNFAAASYLKATQAGLPVQKELDTTNPYEKLEPDASA